MKSHHRLLETIGSAQASAWLQALGEAPLEEVIILPTDMQPRSGAQHRVRNQASQQPLLLEAYPNPSDGPVYVVCNVPDAVTKASLQIRDMNGRLLYAQSVEAGMGVAVLQAESVAAGIYLAELHLDGIRAGQVKLALQ